MRISKQFIVRKIADDFVILPTGTSVLQFQGLITVNEVGAFLWECLQQNDFSAEELAQRLCEEYAVEPQIAHADVEEFLEQIADRGILIGD